MSRSILRRVRMKLAWCIAPYAMKMWVDHQLRMIERDAKTIQDYSIRPSQPDESAQGIERRVSRLRERLDVEEDDGR